MKLFVPHKDGEPVSGYYGTFWEESKEAAENEFADLNAKTVERAGVELVEYVPKEQADIVEDCARDLENRDTK